MCGIFGVTTTKKSKINAKQKEKIFNQLFKLSESRGKEAAGIVLLSKNKIKIFKEAGSVSKLTKNNLYKKLFNNALREKQFSAIGHTRLVTNGRLDDNFNNQPVVKKNLIAIHNGIIVNDKKIWEKFPEMHREYEVDTEVFLSLINKFQKEKKSLTHAIQKTFSIIEGTASIVLLRDNLNHLILATNNGSLYLFKNNEIIFFASEEYILKSIIEKNDLEKGEINQIKPNSLITIYLKNLNLKKNTLNNLGKKIFLKDGIKRKIEDLSPINNKKISYQLNKDQKILKLHPDYEKINNLKRCSKCILPETMPFIKFDEEGVCNYCKNYKKTKLKGIKKLNEEILKYKPNKKQNCIVALSGGRDSSYGLHYAKKELGLNPVAYSYDWGMITDLGRRNQARMCGKLGVEHILISADIKKKRANIKKNVLAWLKKPNLGTIPLFMAGDKQYFYHLNKLQKQFKTDLVIYSENPLEKTDFKTGFCGIRPKFGIKHVYNLGIMNKLKLGTYYFENFLSNPAYLNSTLIDTFSAYLSSYFISHNYLYLFQYTKWDEKKINTTLINNYNWELAKDTETTWRIGDGTAAFYNYIYYTIAGFTENDTFRSNQIREGVLSRGEAIKLSQRDNKPRFESIKWYCDTIGINYDETLKKIYKTKKLC